MHDWQLAVDVLIMTSVPLLTSLLPSPYIPPPLSLHPSSPLLTSLLPSPYIPPPLSLHPSSPLLTSLLPSPYIPPPLSLHPSSPLLTSLLPSPYIPPPLSLHPSSPLLTSLLPSPYIPPPLSLQGAHVLQTLRTYEVLRRLMELPEELHRDRDYNRAYHSLIRAMAPVARDNNNNKNSAKKISGGPSSLSGPRTATTPIVVQLVKVRLNTSVPSLLNSSVPSLLTPSTSASMHRMVTSLGSVEKQSMRPSASMFSISSQAEVWGLEG